MAIEGWAVANKSNVQASSRLKGWWRFRNETLERIAFIVAIVGFPLLVISTCAVLSIYRSKAHRVIAELHFIEQSVFPRR
jgi:hypothetical protein